MEVSGIANSQRLYNGGLWTQAKFNSFIKSILRGGSRRWGPKYQVLNEAKKGKHVNKKTGRMAEHYICNACRELFPATEVEVNHIEPVIPVTGFISWDDVITRLFCEKEGLEVLCKPCHKSVTQQEKLERKVHVSKQR